MDTSTAAGKRKLQFVKCERCRQDKQKCLPTDRVWPQKCERCIGMGEECSEGARKVRKKRNADYSEPSQSPEPAYAQPAIMPPMPRLAPAPPRIPPPTIQDTGDAYQSDQQVGPSVQETGLDAAQPSEMPTIPQDEEAIPSLPPSVLLNAGNMLPDVSHIPGSNAVADSHAVDIGSTEEGVKALLEDWFMTAAFYKMMLMARQHLRNLHIQACETLKESPKASREKKGFTDDIHKALLMKAGKVLATQDKHASPVLLSAIGTWFTDPPKDVITPGNCKICTGEPTNLNDNLNGIVIASKLLTQSQLWAQHLEHQSVENGPTKNCICAHVVQYQTLASKVADKGKALLAIELAKSAIPRWMRRHPVYFGGAHCCCHTAMLPTTFINEKDCLQRTLLHRYLDSSISDSNIQNFLVDADVRAKDYLGRTPLHIACKKGFVETVSSLLAKGADPAEKDNYGLNALDVAAGAGFALICKRILELHNMPAASIEDSFMICLMHDQLATFRLLVNNKKCVATHRDRRLQLLNASRYGSIGIMREILYKFNDPNIAHDNAASLMQAVWSKQTSAMEILLDHEDTDVNLKDNLGCTALFYAAMAGFRYAVECLTSHPTVNINARDKKGRTPFIIAAINGHDSIVRYLLQDDRVITSLVGTDKDGNEKDFRDKLNDPDTFDQIMAEEGGRRAGQIARIHLS